MASSANASYVPRGDPRDAPRGRDGAHLLDVRDLRVSHGDVTAVWGASLTVDAGQIVSVLGRNGAGKSSLLAGVSGVIRPDSGSVTIGGKDVSRAPAWVRATAGIGLVHEGKRIFRDLTIRENLSVGLPRRRAAEAVSFAFDRWPLLAKTAERAAGTLSGGQQQLLAIASAVVQRPRVLLLDEPSSGIAPMIFDEILADIIKLKEEGLAVVLVEQVVEKVLDGVADRIVVLDRGRVRLDAAVGDVTVDQIAELIVGANMADMPQSPLSGMDTDKS